MGPQGGEGALAPLLEFGNKIRHNAAFPTKHANIFAHALGTLAPLNLVQNVAKTQKFARRNNGRSF